VKVGDLMKRTFETVHPDVTLDEVAPQLKRHDPLPVVERGRLIGLLRQGDLDAEPLSRAPAGFRGPRAVRIRDVIAPEVVYCLESTAVEEAAELMRELRVASLPVLDRRQNLVGVLVAADLPADPDGRTNGDASPRHAESAR
jgi:CBS domain-containing protein